MNNPDFPRFKQRAAVLALASCLAVPSGLTHAAGLGRITVLSGLGQPLRAELDVSATREELGGMSVRLAPHDAFKQAGVDYNPVLSDLGFAVEKRPNGKSVIKVSSSRPVNEPFLDFILELNWANGRVVREYTFLLDPPDVVQKNSRRALSTVEARPLESLPDTLPAPQAAPSAPKAQAAAPLQSTPVVPKAKVAPVGTRQVKVGDTLGKIAESVRPEGVSLEQMLLGLYRANPDAFLGKNMHRLKAGAILDIPDQASVQDVSQGEAKKVLHAHSNDWNAYRQKLASAAQSVVPAADLGGQSSSGKITPKLDEKVPLADKARDQVKVARGNQSSKTQDNGAASEEERIAKAQALKEAQERLGMLEKNVSDLQRLLELKDQKLAVLEQQLTSKPLPQNPPPAPAAVPVPAPAPQPLAESPAKPETPPAEPPKAAEPPASVDVAKAVAESPKEFPVAEKAPAPVVAEEPEEAPGFFDELIRDPLPLAGGAGVLALLGGFLFMRRRKPVAVPADTLTLPLSDSSFLPNSVFNGTGGQSVDTSKTPLTTGEFSQAGPGSIDTDEVDPVAEADVYMAYGRDAQAEEILLEALHKDPQRTAIPAKLLEIYYNRRSVGQFETLASELYAQTAGQGADWERVVAMGRLLDPGNPLYSASKPATEVAPLVEAAPAPMQPPIVPEFVPEPVPVALPPESEPEVALDAGETGEPTVLDFDLESSLVTAMAEQRLDPSGIDFDIGTASAIPLATEPEQRASDVGFGTEIAAAPADDAIDFEIPVADPAPVLAPEPVALELPAEPKADLALDDADSLEFDLSLTESTVLGQPMPSFDMSSISLDLASEDAQPAEPEMPVTEAEPFDPVLREEVSTKLDLAKAYEEMGDMEGARELLNEVIADGPPDLVAEATEIISRIDA